SGGALSEMVDRITTNHTYFMREMDHFNFFRNEVLPYLKTAVKDRDLRIWSAGCSSGQEPYALAMLLADYFHDEKDKWDTTVLATDISSQALETAREGIYSDEALSALPNHWKLQYIKKLAPNQNIVSDAIKKSVVFRKFNLMDKNFPFKKAFHVIFCRNVMIYFDNDTKRELVKRYYDSTVSGGYLFIGQSESLNKSLTDYKYIIPAVYRKG
ncbi:MAG: CheR family methyltransferase, partial [Ignavibacteriales bacterium]